MRNKLRSIKDIVPIIFIFFALTLRLTSEPTASLSFFLLAAYAVIGRAQAIQALAMSWLFTMINPGIAPSSSMEGVGRYVVLISAAISVIYHSGLLSGHIRVLTFSLFTIFLGSFLVIHSFIVSPIPDVSIFKAVSWVLATVTLMSAWLGLKADQHARLSQQIFMGLVVVFIVSLPLAVLPVGYLRNGSGFQGILNHPQAFGPAMALLGAWSLSRMLGEPRPSWRLCGLVGGCFVVVFMSEARTALLAMLLGVGLAVFIGTVLSGKSIINYFPGLKSKRVWSVVYAGLTVSILMVPTIGALAQDFITKSGRADVGGVVDAYNVSRGGLMDRMQANIAEHPFSGIGFGIASEPEFMRVERDPFFNLPVSAPVEKGIVPLAVLEEVGILGAAIVSFWLLWLLIVCLRAGLAPLSVALTALAMNMGEATFFSPGGMGLLSLILFAWAFSSGRQSRN